MGILVGGKKTELLAVVYMRNRESEMLAVPSLRVDDIIRCGWYVGVRDEGARILYLKNQFRESAICWWSLLEV